MRFALFFALALGAAAQDAIVLRPARVFDGETTHEGWAVRVRGGRIEAAGPAASVYGTIDLANDVANEAANNAAGARVIDLPGTTLMAGFTTVRDLGTEGAGCADVELKQAVEQGIVPGPRILASTRSIVATGSYAPKGFALEWSRTAAMRCRASGGELE